MPPTSIAAAATASPTTLAGAGAVSLGRRLRHAPALLWLLLGSAVFLLSLAHHPRLACGGEYDQYLQHAEAVLRGEPRDDSFHPMLTSLLIAASGRLVGDAFVGGKLMAAMACTGLLFGLHRLLAVRLPPAVALGATVAIALNPLLWLQGMLVSSDALGTALVVGAYAVALTAAPRPRTWLLAGFLGGAAIAARQNLILHVALILLLAVRWPPRWRLGAMAGFGILLGSALHWLPRQWLFGHTLGSANWQNIVLKYECNFDMQQLQNLPEGAAAQLLRDHWWSWSQRGLADLGDWLWFGLPRDLLGNAAADAPWARGAVLSLLLLCLGNAIWHRSRLALVLFAAAAAHAVFVCLVFYAEPRVMLPCTLAITVGLMLALPVPVRWRGLAAALLALALGGTALATMPRAWAQFREAHAEVEVAAARDVVREHGEWTQLAGTYPFLDREVRCAGVGWVVSFGRRPGLRAEDLWQRLDSVRPATWFVLGRATEHTMHALARTAELPAGWRRHRADDDVVVLERLEAESFVLRGMGGIWREGAYELRLAGSADARADIAWLGVLLQGPAGEELRLQFPPVAAVADGAAPGEPTLTLPWGLLGRGVWRAVPLALYRDRRIGPGTGLEIQVE